MGLANIEWNCAVCFYEWHCFLKQVILPHSISEWLVVLYLAVWKLPLNKQYKSPTLISSEHSKTRIDPKCFPVKSSINEGIEKRN